MGNSPIIDDFRGWGGLGGKGFLATLGCSIALKRRISSNTLSSSSIDVLVLLTKNSLPNSLTRQVIVREM